jgi:hypothetical protein
MAMCLILWFRGSGSFDCGFGISDFGLKRPDGADTGYGLVPIVVVVLVLVLDSIDSRGEGTKKVRLDRVHTSCTPFSPSPIYRYVLQCAFSFFPHSAFQLPNS